MKLPFLRQFGAMTVYPHIYTRHSELPKQMLRHEQVHLVQQKKQGWTYYPIYFWKWIKNIRKYGFTMGAYFAIDWERQAYVLANPDYLTYAGYPELDSDPFQEEK